MHRLADGVVKEVSRDKVDVEKVSKKMEKSKWSDYARYVALSDNSNMDLKGNYQTFLNFKKVMEIVNNIASSDKSSYLYDGDIYSRKITSTDARKIIDNINQCRWTESTKKMSTIASQLQVII